jgi:hypothetical protein
MQARRHGGTKARHSKLWRGGVAVGRRSDEVVGQGPPYMLHGCYASRTHTARAAMPASNRPSELGNPQFGRLM